ncbi:ATP synthase F0 subcomplex A subunit [Zobellia uliginosa]|uniref:ATP synthase subunit a n=1 Tax=Zobellia uliginosa TaxID=143224 RepID=A0ABY1KNF4_9FLAO|nr:F0F1 ATP synthase subunit A [Zobellia uliginosa]SIS53468.1 ATP synthase F0 subcomplex A subunit [Zobellia uliginosa]
MELSPDETIFWQNGFITINLTLVTTWVLMFVLVLASVLVTRKLRSDLKISRWQCILEMLVTGMNQQIKEVGLKKSEKFLGFIGTLFIFIAFANLCIIFPGYEPPTSSLSTTVALALCVFLATPLFGIAENGVLGYLKTFIEPTFIMLPFNIISEVSRTLALAVRLFGNIMSGGLIVTILLGIAPLFFPVLMTVLGLITGVIQAYIFSILATVYIAAATEESDKKKARTKKMKHKSIGVTNSK